MNTIESLLYYIRFDMEKVPNQFRFFQSYRYFFSFSSILCALNPENIDYIFNGLPSC